MVTIENKTVVITGSIYSIVKKIEFTIHKDKRTYIYNTKIMIKKIIEMFKPKPQVMLGRWIRTTPKLTNIKIDYANEDHCGTCSNDNKSILSNNNKKNKDKTDSK